MRTNDDVPLADDTFRLIADARQESIRMRHEYIGTEHILLALTNTRTAYGPLALADIGVDAARANQLLEGKGVAAHVLYDQGVTAELVENTLRHAADRGGA